MTDFQGCAVQQYLLFVLFPLHVLVFPGMLCTPDNRMIFSYEGCCLEREESASRVGLGTSGSLWLAVPLKVYLGIAAHSNVSLSWSPTNLMFDFQQSVHIVSKLLHQTWNFDSVNLLCFYNMPSSMQYFSLFSNCSWFLKCIERNKLVGKSRANLFNTWRNFFPEKSLQLEGASWYSNVSQDRCLPRSDESVCQCLFIFWKIVAPKRWDLNIIEYSSLTTFCG